MQAREFYFLRFVESSEVFIVENFVFTSYALARNNALFIEGKTVGNCILLGKTRGLK